MAVLVGNDYCSGVNEVLFVTTLTHSGDDSGESADLTTNDREHASKGK